MIYEQFIVSIVELIMLSWQPILLFNFHNMRVTWLFSYFFKLQVHILHSLENISIFNIWKLWLVRCDVIFSGTSLLLSKMSENFWSKEIPLWWFPDSTLKLNNSRTAWPIPAYTYRSPAFWTLFYMKSTCFRVAVLLKKKMSFPAIPQILQKRRYSSTMCQCDTKSKPIFKLRSHLLRLTSLLIMTQNRSFSWSWSTLWQIRL